MLCRLPRSIATTPIHGFTSCSRKSTWQKGDRPDATAQWREYWKFATDPEDVAVVRKYLPQLERAQPKQRDHWLVVAARSALPFAKRKQIV
ncbi:MAG: hypothetical protein WB762_17120 [Candidatus Sulfotelmatobacter sp.]